MTERVSRETQELRDFVDALRVWLGMRPLYFEGPDKTMPIRSIAK